MPVAEFLYINPHEVPLHLPTPTGGKITVNVGGTVKGDYYKRFSREPGDYQEDTMKQLIRVPLGDHKKVWSYVEEYREGMSRKQLRIRNPISSPSNRVKEEIKVENSSVSETINDQLDKGQTEQPEQKVKSKRGRKPKPKPDSEEKTNQPPQPLSEKDQQEVQSILELHGLAAPNVLACDNFVISARLGEDTIYISRRPNYDVFKTHDEAKTDAQQTPE